MDPSARGKKIHESDKEKYVFLYGLSEDTQDRVMMRNLAITLVFAGKDSIGSLICFTLRYLAQSPEA